VRGTRAIAVVVAALGLAVVLAPGKAWAPVPPRDCGMLDVGVKRFNVKADQIRCRTARRYTKRYLTSDRAPSGFRCRDYGRETRIEFRCTSGDKVLFAIRR
jgi:hypothetical protein